ncbi:MAG: hypothetical protein JWO36_283 [Myxococcales bacterium]|nr:hypothetical protein [Myxococcales bacterium]
MRIKPQVELDLSGVGRLEVAELQLDRDQSLHASVEEQQIEVVVVAIEHDPLRPLDEREAGAELEEEALDLTQDRRREVLLAVGVGEVEKVEHVRVAKDERGLSSPLSRSADSPWRMSVSGFFDSAVRS